MMRRSVFITILVFSLEHVVAQTPERTDSTWKFRTVCISSIPDSREPIYIVDGKEVKKNQLLKLDTSQIAKISVIKSHEATALYGSRADYGVVSIELKKSKRRWRRR